MRIFACKDIGHMIRFGDDSYVVCGNCKRVVWDWSEVSKYRGHESHGPALDLWCIQCIQELARSHPEPRLELRQSQSLR